MGAPSGLILNLTDREHQDWFRMMAGFYTEEVFEFYTAQGKGDAQEVLNELSDCLHFAVELAILAGLEHNYLDTFHSVRSLEEAPQLPSLMESLHSLYESVNCLKLKPWKHSGEPFRNSDLWEFQYGVRKCLWHLILVIKSYTEMPLDELYGIKNKVNHQRLEGGY